MIDVDAVLCEHLKAAGSSLYALTATRVYCPCLPPKRVDGTAMDNTQAMLEVLRVGGSSLVEVEEHAVRYQIKCYGGTQNFDEAEAVYRALYDRLHGEEDEETASGTIMDAQQEGVGQPIQDPDSGWPFILTFWQVRMRPSA